LLPAGGYGEVKGSAFSANLYQTIDFIKVLFVAVR